MIELPSQQKNNFFVLHARVPIFWFKVVYHHTNFVLKAQRPAKKLTIDLRPTYHPMAYLENFRKTHPARDFSSAILHVRDPIFWLRALHP